MNQLLMDGVKMHGHLQTTFEARPTPLEGHRWEFCPDYTLEGEVASGGGPESSAIDSFSRVNFPVCLSVMNGAAEELWKKTESVLLVGNHESKLRLVAKSCGKDSRQCLGPRRIQSDCSDLFLFFKPDVAAFTIPEPLYINVFSTH